jgi:hypothetical protein
MNWLKDAGKYVLDNHGLIGIAVIVGLALLAFVAAVLAVTYTPLGAWVAAWMLRGEVN